MSPQLDFPPAGSRTAGKLPPESWACPSCAGPLCDSGGNLRCSRCSQTWPVIEGVPHFIADFPYWGEISKTALRAINQAAQNGNWKSALLAHPDPSVARAARMMLNLDRANWHLLANLSSRSRVLDLGAGSGAITHALARHYREVVALEPVLERVEFMRHRFSQEGISNAKLVRSTLWTLPFAKESFDLVAMNGVLEWVAEGESGDPRELQKRALQNVCGLLKPGGCLYVGIENRFTLGYFAGYPDPHCGLPFVTVLPRPLAQWYARKKGANGYRNYLYSSRGYRKLLNQSGFKRVEFYLALPTYNEPRFLIPLQGDGFAYYCRHFSAGNSGGLRALARNFLLRLNLLKHFEYSFAILAYK